MANKKAQGLSLTTIIVAAIALIVLVVLVMIFTGRIGVFSKGVEQAGESELAALRITYGDCHPTLTKEAVFRDAMNKATSEAEKDAASSNLKSDIASCKAYTDQGACEGAGCSWK